MKKMLPIILSASVLLTACGSDRDTDDSIERKTTTTTAAGTVDSESASAEFGMETENDTVTDAETDDPLDIDEDASDYVPTIKKYSIGSTHAGIISQNDELYLWGSEASGKLANGESGTMAYECDPVKVMKNIDSFSLGYNNTAAVTTSGDLYIWGSNKYYELGIDDEYSDNKSTPQFVMGNVKQVSCGATHCAAVTNDGELFVWGDNEHGELAVEDNRQSSPVKIMDNVKTAVMGYEYSAAINEDGDLYMWGANSAGQLGDGTTEDKFSPVKVMEGVKIISLGVDHTAAITENGDLYIWGYNGASKLGLGIDDEYITEPTFLMGNVKDVSLGAAFSAAVTEDGKLYLWGSDYCGQQGDGDGRALAPTETPVFLMDNVDSVYASKDSIRASCACLTMDGELFAWGMNDWGQLGTGGIEYHDEPVKIELFGDR